MYSPTEEFQRIHSPSFKLFGHEMIHDLTQRCTHVRGVFAIDSKGADSHRAALFWRHQNPDNESSTTFLYPFTCTCEIYVHLCGSMNCPCVCINYLLVHLRKAKFESTFQYLPSHVQSETYENKQFCLNLYHQVFITENGIQIINNQTTRNNDRNKLLVQYPITQQK